MIGLLLMAGAAAVGIYVFINRCKYLGMCTKSGDGKLVPTAVPGINHHCKPPAYWDREYGPHGHCYDPTPGKGITDSAYTRIAI